VPVLHNGKLVGIVTDSDLRSHMGFLDKTEARVAMSEALVTVSPTSPVQEVARILVERKIGALPVVEEGQLVGVLTTTDVLEAFTED
jgi:acetoin utilization protein AcuB